MLTRSHPSARIGADYIAISTVCATKLQTRPAPTSIQISAHLLEPQQRNGAFPHLWYFIRPLGLVLSWEPWEKQAAGGGVGWETPLRASWTIVFCQQRTEWENHPAGGKKPLPICGEKICSASDRSRRQLLNRYPWSSFALCVPVSKFCVSFCLIRNLTMFSLVKRLKQWSSQWCFSSLFSLKRYQLACHTFFFSCHLGI